MSTSNLPKYIVKKMVEDRCEWDNKKLIICAYYTYASESETSMWKNEQFLWSGNLAIFFLFLCLFFSYVKPCLSNMFSTKICSIHKKRSGLFPRRLPAGMKKTCVSVGASCFTCTYKRHSHDGYFIMFYYIFCLCSSVFFFLVLYERTCF